jgi:dihydroorotase
MKTLHEWRDERTYIVANVTIVDPAGKRSFKGHVAVNDGAIASVGASDPASDAGPVFDGEGLHLAPGFVDIHTHLREPGFEHKEDIYSGSIAAAAGGFTSIACMPNTEPAIDDKSVVEYILKKANIAGFAKVYPVAAATMGRKGEKLCEYNRLISAGAVAFSDDGSPVASAQMMRRVLEYSSHFGVPVIEHCEDTSTAENGAMNEGFYSTKLGLPGIPAYSEEICLARDLILLNAIPARLHIAHVSTKGSVEMIREAKRRGLPVTAETAPHYITFDDSELETYNTSFKINPPIRGIADRDALIEGLQDGTLDCIATDHAPHALEEKEVEFEYAPPGAIGLETAFAAINTHLVKAGHLKLHEAVALITGNAARILNLPGGTLESGAPADFALFDPDEEWVVAEGDFHSKSKNSPYIGRTLYGRIKYTIIDGRVMAIASLESGVVGR